MGHLHLLKIIIFLGIFITGVVFFIPNEVHYVGTEEVTIPERTSSEEISLLFVGDIMLSREIGNIIEKEGFNFPYALIGSTTADADITFGNLETSVSDRGTNVGSKYSFRSDPKSLPALREAGFDVMSVANNHIWDWGKIAFGDTLENLKLNKIEPVGGGQDYNEAHSPVIVEKNGTKIAFLAYTNLLPKFLLGASSSPAVALGTTEILKNDIANAKTLGVDIVVTSFHWGEEYQLIQNEYQENLAHAAIDNGALIVVGHHPHVIQEIERYKDGVIMYSLGNFVFDQNFSEDTRKGLIVKIGVLDQKIQYIDPVEIRFSERYQPFISK